MIDSIVCMDNTVEKNKRRLAINHTPIFFIISTLLCFLFIRKYFILLFPFHILWGFYVFKLKLSANQLLFLCISFLFTFVSFIFSDRYILNYIMSVSLIYFAFVFF